MPFSFKKFREKPFDKQLFMILGAFMVVAYTILGLMFIFYDPMQLIIRQPAFRKIVGVCIIFYAIVRFTKLRNNYLH